MFLPTILYFHTTRFGERKTHSLGDAPSDMQVLKESWTLRVSTLLLSHILIPSTSQMLFLLGSVKLPFREFSGREKEEKEKRGLDYHRSSVCDIPFICTLTWMEWGKQV